jgi:hypothetical protein
MKGFVGVGPIQAPVWSSKKQWAAVNTVRELISVPVQVPPPTMTAPTLGYSLVLSIVGATPLLMLMALAGWDKERAIAAVPLSKTAARRAITPERL